MLQHIATVYRAAQFYSHAAHNQISGCSFFADHSFAGEVYDSMTEAYDSLVERAIGTGEMIDLFKTNVDAAAMIKDFKLDTAKDIFGQFEFAEKAIQRELKNASKDASYGTDNLLAGLADDSEVRSYKIKQRLKNI